ncbi:MAG TPA: hypothetical protein VH054_15815 [Polyangiaceae bacterium]|jgi:hypothetical protein|nr:hypothetical protein [Polyangiaceae bacterium]
MDGALCETSFDCGDLKCIDQICRDPHAPFHVEEHATTIGHQLMFGTGKGYGLLIAVLDILAAASTPVLLYEAGMHSGEPQTGFGISCFVTVGLVGSTTHFAHARVLPGIASLFAWPAGAALTFAFAGLIGLGGSLRGEFNEGAAWVAGIGLGAIAATGLTALDVYMARPMMKKKPVTPSFTLAPSFVPLRDGALGALGGTF